MGLRKVEFTVGLQAAVKANGRIIKKNSIYIQI